MNLRWEKNRHQTASPGQIRYAILGLTFQTADFWNGDFDENKIERRVI